MELIIIIIFIFIWWLFLVDDFNLLKYLKRKTNKEKYEALLKKKRKIAFNRWEYKFDFNPYSNYYSKITFNDKILWSEQYYEWLSEYKWNFAHKVYNIEMKKLREARKQEEIEKEIEEEIKYTQKIQELMNIKINKEVEKEFSPLFKKAERLNKITKQAVALMKEAKQIRNEFNSLS